MVSDPAQQAARQRWMSVLARSSAEELQSCRERLSCDRSWSLLRKPETGLVMVRARAGGQGKQFNLGEATMTRCSVRLDSGEIGHAYITGRDKRHAELAAFFDAVAQDPAQVTQVEEVVIGPIAERLRDEKQARAAKVAATKVDFFTLARGEDS